MQKCRPNPAPVSDGNYALLVDGLSQKQYAIALIDSRSRKPVEVFLQEAKSGGTEGLDRH